MRLCEHKRAPTAASRTAWCAFGIAICIFALGLVTGWAWRSLPQVTRLIIPIFAWNTASERVAQKCGYVKEADMPRSAIKAGRVIDRVQYASYRR